LGAVSTTVTKFVVTGTALGSATGSTQGNFSLDLSGSIGALFGQTTVPASTTITGTYRTNNVAPPEEIELLFSGVDAGGYAWTTTATAFLNGTVLEIDHIANGASFQAVAVPVGSPDPPPDATNVQQSIFAPGMILTVFGKGSDNLSSFTAAPQAPLPSYLAGPDGSSFVQAAISGTPAPLFYVAPYDSKVSPPAPSQINLQIPYELQSSFSATATSLPAVLTLNNSGVMASFSFTVQPVAPGIFTTHGVWNTPAAGAPTINNQEGPAAPGSLVTVYFTGAGALKTPGVIDGQAAVASTPTPLSTVIFTVSGNDIDPQIVSSASSAVTVAMLPGAVGVAQASFTVPAGLKAGDYKLTITLQGVVGTGATAVTLPPVTGNTVNLWVGTAQ
jgi:uncharacterized protein (TIGR03437 family)